MKIFGQRSWHLLGGNAFFTGEFSLRDPSNLHSRTCAWYNFTKENAPNPVNY